MLNWAIAALIAAAVLIAAGLAVLSLVDDQRVRRTDELLDWIRAGETPDGGDEVGDDVIRMLAAWRDESR